MFLIQYFEQINFWVIQNSSKKYKMKIFPYLLSSNLSAYLLDSQHKWFVIWSWEILKVRGEVDNRGSDGWMASLTQWTWVCANSGRWWKTGKPGMLQSMGQLRDWTNLSPYIYNFPTLHFFLYIQIITCYQFIFT